MTQEPQNVLEALDMNTVAALFQEAKQAEDNAISYRRHLGEEIARRLEAPDSIPAVRNERTDQFKVSVRYENRVKINPGEAALLVGAVDTPIFNNLVKTSYEVSSSYLKFLRNNEPDLFEKVAPFLTSKPSSPQVTVESR